MNNKTLQYIDVNDYITAGEVTDSIHIEKISKFGSEDVRYINNLCIN